MKLRKIIGYILITFASLMLLFIIINDAWKVGVCADMTRSDIANPTQSVEQYASHSLVFDELCDPASSTISFLVGIGLIWFGVYLTKQEKNKLNKAN